ncbi:MAG: fluoride efflux transporter CrcB [Candidatus Methanoplasma sp.]|nr:fluoride efflux transporter CrcB [Candidatus Methanoplasma sp.]
MYMLLVGIGGFIGSVGRYCLTILMNKTAPSFPFGTLLSNVIAGFLIGFIIGAEGQTVALPEKTKTFLTVGLLGGLSTFSAFSLETVTMFENGKYVAACANILLNVGLSLISAVIGMSVARMIFK